VPWRKGAVANSEHVYGLLINSPFAFFFLAFLLDRKTRRSWAADVRLMVNMLLAFSGCMFAFLLVFVYSLHRYNVDYTPWVMALAGMYYLSLLQRASGKGRLALFLLGILCVSFGIFTGWALSMCNPTNCPLRAA
jgi:hypothetical protein